MNFGQLVESETNEELDNAVSNPPSKTVSRQSSIVSVRSLKNENNSSLEPQNEENEEKTVGSVGGWVYKEYFKAAGNYCVIFLIILLCVLSQVAGSAADMFITIWVGFEELSVSII